jgi:hypothetical protein
MTAKNLARSPLVRRLGLAALLLVAMLVGACQSSGRLAPTAMPTPAPLMASPTATATAISTPTFTPTLTPAPTRLPPTAALTPTPQPVGGLPYFGITMQHISNEFGLAQAQAAGVQVVRLGAVSWAAVEPERTEPPTYHWEALAGLERDLVAAREAGLEVVLLVLYTPDWAQVVPGHSCGPIREERLAAFAEFLQAAVQRYREPPFGIRYWELFNEPDVDPALVGSDSGFGCWGDETDEFYGGRTFGRMLQAAYPAIKAADPGALVILGGLLLDDAKSVPGQFFRGVLEGGGGDYFDILAFHGYTFYAPDVYDWDRLPGTKWVDRGGIVAGKTAFLRQVMADYGYDKPLMLNEAGLAGTRPGDPDHDYRLAQADYVVQLYARGLALGLANITWFGWQGPGWRQMALLNHDLSPQPAYYALAFFIQELGEAVYAGPLDYAGVEGYAFARADTQIQVLWSKDGGTYEVQIPANRFLRAWTTTGESLQPIEGQKAVQFEVLRPIYVELEGNP